MVIWFRGRCQFPSLPPWVSLFWSLFFGSASVWRCSVRRICPFSPCVYLIICLCVQGLVCVFWVVIWYRAVCCLLIVVGLASGNSPGWLLAPFDTAPASFVLLSHLPADTTWCSRLILYFPGPAPELGIPLRNQDPSTVHPLGYRSPISALFQPGELVSAS